jgi:hypothetical protein
MVEKVCRLHSLQLSSRTWLRQLETVSDEAVWLAISEGSRWTCKVHHVGDHCQLLSFYHSCFQTKENDVKWLFE